MQLSNEQLYHQENNKLEKQYRGSMKRPQSAKHGHRGVWAQMSSDDISDQQNIDNHYQHRKKVKIMKPDFTTNDFARLMPKKIHQDKERLYSELLQLKQNLNETVQENTRLKTKIAILEKQKDKMTKFIDSSDIAISNKAPSRLNVFPNKSSEKENSMVRNLKKMIRESKQQNDFLKQENMKIKKAIKYTKINQLQVERKLLLDENTRLNTIMQELNEQVNMQGDYEKEIRELRRYLEEEVENNKELSDANQNYIEYIESLEEKFKKEEEKTHEKEKKLQRDLALSKRKLSEEIRVADELRKEIKLLRESNQPEKKKIQQPIRGNLRPTSSNPYAKRINQTSSLSEMPNKKQVEDLKEKNQKLFKELEQVKSKLKSAEQTITRKSKTQQQNVVQKAVKEQQNQPFIIENDRAFKKQKSYKVQELKQQSKVSQSEKSNQYDEYDQDAFQEEKASTKKESPSPTKKKLDDQIERYKKDFTEEAEEQQIYQKEPEHQEKPKPKKPQKTQKNQKAQKIQKVQKNQKKGKKEKEKEKTGAFKPDKKNLQAIKELLTYRMKAQRYPFDELQNDIKQSGESSFQFVDLENMLKNQPFFLTEYYERILLQYIFESQKPSSSSKTTWDNLTKKLRKVIDDFELPQEKQEEQMLLRIAEMTSTYPNELEAAFQKVKNGDGTLSKQHLIDMFKKLELADNYIQLIISELSLCSQDLQHLSYYGFFERFYISQAQEELEQGINTPIDQEQIESSGGSSRPVRKSVRKSKQVQKVNEEEENYEDEYNDEEQPNFVLDKDEKVQLSMGVKDSQPYLPDDDIVSDDGKI